MAADCEPGDGCCPHHRHYGLGSPHGCVVRERSNYPFDCIPPPVFSEGQCTVCREVVKIGPVTARSYEEIDARIREMHDCPAGKAGSQQP